MRPTVLLLGLALLVSAGCMPKYGAGAGGEKLVYSADDIFQFVQMTMKKSPDEQARARKFLQQVLDGKVMLIRRPPRPGENLTGDCEYAPNCGGGMTCCRQTDLGCECSQCCVAVAP